MKGINISVRVFSACDKECTIYVHIDSFIYPWFGHMVRHSKQLPEKISVSWYLINVVELIGVMIY